MEVDEQAFPSSSSENVKVEEKSESRPGSVSTTKDHILKILDQVETHVDKLCKKASNLEHEQNQLLCTLHTLDTLEEVEELDEIDREDILKFVERLTNRCKSVDITINTQRDESQVESLHQVNCLINHLIVGMKDDIDQSKNKCLNYVSSLSSTVVIDDGNIDRSFESAVLGCALDDQRRIRQRLLGLLDFISNEKNKRDMQFIE